MKTWQKMLLSAAWCLAATGCAVDGVNVTEYTSRTDPNGTVTAKYSHLVMVMSTSRNLVQAIRRDSLHLGLGLPAGWTVASAGYYAALHFRPLRDFFHDGQVDTQRLLLAMTDSLAAFESRKQALEADPGMLAYFQNRTFTASDSAKHDTTLNTDSVGQWAGYRGLLGINLAAGEPMDTFFLDTSSGAMFDTIGLTLIPVYVYVTLRANSTPGLYSIFSYGKSGPVPDPLDTSLNVDAGDFAYFPVQVGPVALEKAPAAGPADFWLDAYPNPARGPVSIRFRTGREPGPALEVFSVGGALVRKLGLPEIPAAGALSWDGRDQRGAPVQSGAYVLRLRDGGRSIAKKIQIVR